MKKITQKFILIGPLPPPLGGDTRHFLMMKNFIFENSLEKPLLINTSRTYIPNNFLYNFFILNKIIFQIIIKRSKYNTVFFMASDRGILLSIVPLTLICRFLKKELYIRICGGSFHTSLENLNSLLKKLIILVLDKLVSKIFVQTKELKNYLSDKTSKTKIFRVGSYPINTISLEKIIQFKKSKNFRFLYAGHLRKVKGVGLLLEVMESLNKYNIECHFAGRESDITNNDINNVNGCKYLGVFDYSEMVELIAKYNFLIMPTWHKGEGEPGVIVESLEACTPIIATKFRGIIDIVDDNVGILIKLKSFNELRESILNSYLNQKLSKNYENELLRRKIKIGSYKSFWEEKLLEAINYPN